MAKFRIDPAVLAHLLDLPDGTELGVVERVPVGKGQHVYEIAITGEGWPDAGVVDLHYAQDEHGVISLKGFTAVE